MSDASTIPSRKRRALLASLAMGLVMCAALPASACGYHDSQALARGMLNWIYPRALHVQTAVWQAENAGILPPRNSQQRRDLFAFRKMVSHLEMLGVRLSSTDGRAEPVSFSAVLLDFVLWVRFAATPQGYVMRLHVDGPETGDVVIVTHGKVIRALAEAAVDSANAEMHGLLRFYGPAPDQDKVRAVLGTPALPGVRTTVVTDRESTSQ